MAAFSSSSSSAAPVDEMRSPAPAPGHNRNHIVIPETPPAALSQHPHRQLAMGLSNTTVMASPMVSPFFAPPSTSSGGGGGSGSGTDASGRGMLTEAQKQTIAQNRQRALAIKAAKSKSSESQSSTSSGGQTVGKNSSSNSTHNGASSVGGKEEEAMECVICLETVTVRGDIKVCSHAFCFEVNEKKRVHFCCGLFLTCVAFLFYLNFTTTVYPQVVPSD
jgi:hypothetical protein